MERRPTHVCIKLLTRSLVISCASMRLRAPWHRLAEGPVEQVLTQERLEALDDARVQKGSSGIVFFPG